REDARTRLEREQHVDEDRLLLLERARERDLARELLEQQREDLLGRVRLDLRRDLQAAPPSTCRRAARVGASRAGSLPRAGCSRGCRSARSPSRTMPGPTS